MPFVEFAQNRLSFFYTISFLTKSLFRAIFGVIDTTLAALTRENELTLDRVLQKPYNGCKSGYRLLKGDYLCTQSA